MKYLNPFKPEGWQINAFMDKSFIMLCTGSAGGGKSKLAAEKCHLYALMYPGSTVLLLRKRRESMKNSTILFFERMVVGRDSNVKHKKVDHRFEYLNGSVVIYGGMKDDTQREQIRSIGQEGGVDLVWMEEATEFTEDDFNEITARMRGRASSWRQIILTTNPGPPSHWIYQRLISKKEASIYFSSNKDNKYNPSDYDDILNRLTGMQRLRLKEGKWVQAEGVVYKDFNRDEHIIEPFYIPESWKRIRVIDFGYNNPFVCLWMAKDPIYNHIYVYRQHYLTNFIVQDHAKIIKQYSYNERYESTIADHDAEDRATLEREGIDTIAAFKPIIPGIQAVQARLRKEPETDPKLYFFNELPVYEDNELKNKKRVWCIQQEIESYVYKNTSSTNIKEEPLKENDHAMDCLRYGVAYFDALKEGTDNFPWEAFSNVSRETFNRHPQDHLNRKGFY